MRKTFASYVFIIIFICIYVYKMQALFEIFCYITSFAVMQLKKIQLVFIIFYYKIKYTIKFYLNTLCLINNGLYDFLGTFKILKVFVRYWVIDTFHWFCEHKVYMDQNYICVIFEILSKCVLFKAHKTCMTCIQYVYLLNIEFKKITIL